ncbi:MAG TPA: hypothetical protein VHW90_08120 [Stellaceae bacterium]|nr:hypothetical protein [Stellaceae bacterium]
MAIANGGELAARLDRSPMTRHIWGSVFGFIAFAMVIVVASIGGFSPNTRGLALERIAH